MNEADKAQLCTLIENEITFGFTLTQTARLASSDDHREQAWTNAFKAYKTAQQFIASLAPDEIHPIWLLRLTELHGILRCKRKNWG